MPKPLVPILNVPLLFWLVQTLHDAHATYLVANTYTFHAQMSAAAERLRDRDGISLTLVREDRLTGPAGGLAACREILPAADCYLVVSGDAWAEFDVAELVDSHRSTDADLTILATRVSAPYRFGVLELVDGFDIVGLRARSQTASPDALVSCGIYVVGERALRLLAPPAAGEYDYKDFVPLLLSRGMTVKAHVLRGFWDDVGDLDAYLSVNLRALGSGAASRVAAPAGPQVWLQPGAALGANVTVTGPVLVGPGAVVEPETVLGHAIVGPGAHVEAGASVIGSVVASGTVVAAGRSVEHEVAL
jgi:mannose-1-phosphate guanylyltransferase